MIVLFLLIGLAVVLGLASGRAATRVLNRADEQDRTDHARDVAAAVYGEQLVAETEDYLRKEAQR